MSGASSPSLYFFCGHYPSSHSYSLFRVNINLEVEVIDSSYATLFEFETKNFPADGMKCARLGNKFYFLGGTDFSTDPINHPREVHEFDISTGVFKTMDAPLNSGKYDPCQVFALDDKLYALGSGVAQSLRFLDPRSYHMNIFECLDPNNGNGEWQILEDPPFSGEIFWKGCAVLPKRGLAVVVASASDSPDNLTEFIYQDNKWNRQPIFYQEAAVALGLQEGDDGNDYLYGIHVFGRPFKSKLLHPLVGGDFIKMSIPDRSTFPIIYKESITMLRHLRDSYFCHIECNQDAPQINITLFREECGEGSSRAQILASQSLDLGTRDSSVQGCFVVTLDEHKEECGMSTS